MTKQTKCCRNCIYYDSYEKVGVGYCIKHYIAGNVKDTKFPYDSCDDFVSRGKEVK